MTLLLYSGGEYKGKGELSRSVDYRSNINRTSRYDEEKTRLSNLLK